MPTLAAARNRIESVDVVRGVIMIVMALDHTRDFFGNPALDPTNLAVTTVPLFFTRWITHFCAPVFFLLTGTGAYLGSRRKTRPELSRYLWTRGLWLIVLEFTVFRCLAMQFNFDYRMTILTVLWALGWSMIVLAGLVRLPAWVAGVFGTVMVATHNIFDGARFDAFGSLAPFVTTLHVPTFLIATPQVTIFAAYPLIPWIGVTAVGYALGQLYDLEASRRKTLLLQIGIAMVGLFILLRALNVYGNPRPWSVQSSPTFTLLSFLNTHKYPPSFLFLLMTLGPALLFLRAVDDRTPVWLRPAAVFGKVPLLYFLVHMSLIHLLAVVWCFARYGDVHWMFQSPNMEGFPFTRPPGWPAGLPLIYLVWILAVTLLYPLCKWYGGIKAKSRSVWLSYL